MDEKDFLNKLGYSPVEIELYLLLLKMGSSSAGKLVSTLGYHKATVYQTLSRLVEKGIVGFNDLNGLKIYYPISPDVFLHQIKELENEYDNVKIKLNKLKNIKTQNQVTTYVGKKGLKLILLDMLNELNPKGIYYDFGVSGMFKKTFPDFWDIWQIRKKQYNIKSEVILNSDFNKNFPGLIKTYVGKYKILPGHATSLVDTFIYHDKVLICIWDADPPIGILITSKMLAESYKTNFKKMWQEL